MLTLHPPQTLLIVPHKIVYYPEEQARRLAATQPDQQACRFTFRAQRPGSLSLSLPGLPNFGDDDNDEGYGTDERTKPPKKLLSFRSVCLLACCFALPSSSSTSILSVVREWRGERRRDESKQATKAHPNHVWALSVSLFLCSGRLRRPPTTIRSLSIHRDILIVLTDGLVLRFWGFVTPKKGVEITESSNDIFNNLYLYIHVLIHYNNYIYRAR